MREGRKQQHPQEAEWWELLESTNTVPAIANVEAALRNSEPLEETPWDERPAVVATLDMIEHVHGAEVREAVAGVVNFRLMRKSGAW